MKASRISLIAGILLMIAGESYSQSYSNPVIRRDCPDPTMLDDRARSGWFYLYSTQSLKDGSARPAKDADSEDESLINNLPIYRSKDMVNWEFVCDGFPNGRPDWVKDSQLWAPDINYVDGQYVLYYSLGAWAQIFKEGSGVAVSDSPTGPFRDLGEVVSFRSTGATNSIDANLFIDDDGRRYLFWGSLGPGSGIWMIELEKDGYKVKEGARKKHLGASNMEGAYVHKRNGWYYLFTSKGSCCKNEKSSYRMLVSRSRNVDGPYLGPNGEKLKSSRYEHVIMRGDDAARFVGTGHNTQILTDDAGQDWMAYHSYWQENDYASRCLMMDRLLWTEDGWPYFEGGTPSTESELPVITR